MVEDFWRAYNNIPKPSAIFFDGRTKKRFANRSVESFSLFKKNIKPEWEDPQNPDHVAGMDGFHRAGGRVVSQYYWFVPS